MNGEIYNHLDLKETLQDKTPFRTGSDCEIIPHLYKEIGVEVASKLDGDFACAIVDERTGEVKQHSHDTVPNPNLLIPLP